MQKFQGFLESLSKSHLFAAAPAEIAAESEGEPKVAEALKEDNQPEEKEKGGAEQLRLEARVWNQLQSPVDELQYSQHALLLVFSSMKQSLFKADAELTSLVLPRSLIRDILDTCR